jgi:hypothetical protein
MSLKLCQVNMMSGLVSMFGIGSSQAEISDDEASGLSEVEAAPTPDPATIKQEKKAKEVKEKPAEKAKPKVVEKEESLMVESDKDEDDEDDEASPDECATPIFTR